MSPSRSHPLQSQGTPAMLTRVFGRGITDHAMPFPIQREFLEDFEAGHRANIRPLENPDKPCNNTAQNHADPGSERRVFAARAAWTTEKAKNAYPDFLGALKAGNMQSSRGSIAKQGCVADPTLVLLLPVLSGLALYARATLYNYVTRDGRFTARGEAAAAWLKGLRTTIEAIASAMQAPQWPKRGGNLCVRSRSIRWASLTCLATSSENEAPIVRNGIVAENRFRIH
jgi:hypothetical protein